MGVDDNLDHILVGTGEVSNIDRDWTPRWGDNSSVHRSRPRDDVLNRWNVLFVD